MHTCLITFLSQTAANRFKKMAQGKGISISIVQTPKEISAGGCSYGARCNWEDLESLISLARKMRIGFSRIFLEGRDLSGRKYYKEI